MLLSGLTTLGQTVVIIVAATFIAWALITAIFIPKRREVFPRRLDAFIVVSALLFLAQMTTVLWVSETQEVEEAHAETTGGHAEGEGEGTETTGGGEETTGGTETTGETGRVGDAAAGKEVFETAGCASCHTLADAGATGTVGPNLDEAKPPAELVVDRVTNGMGAMPPFSGQLSAEQINDVAAYVVNATSS
jgi:mono/diheme cytochrome c family protein